RNTHACTTPGNGFACASYQQSCTYACAAHNYACASYNQTCTGATCVSSPYECDTYGFTNVCTAHEVVRDDNRSSQTHTFRHFPGY
ncbi:MAG: hypothetical protein FWD15_02935, partial [Alphaproteobacteria bacterium]|nr:hypothetical protein [Alphaproteobacteria bacterium]